MKTTAEKCQRVRTLSEQGVAVHQVGDIYENDADGRPIPEEDRGKWFVSALADSPLASIVAGIPLSSTAAEGWEIAADRLSII